MTDGSSGKFCPVCLSDGHLVLGKPEAMAKFGGKYFVFAGEAEQVRHPHLTLTSSTPSSPHPHLVLT